MFSSLTTLVVVVVIVILVASIEVAVASVVLLMMVCVVGVGSSNSQVSRLQVQLWQTNGFLRASPMDSPTFRYSQLKLYMYNVYVFNATSLCWLARARAYTPPGVA